MLYDNDDLILCIVLDNMKIQWLNVSIKSLDNKCRNLYLYLKNYFNLDTLEILDSDDKNILLYKSIRYISEKNPNRLFLRIFY